MRERGKGERKREDGRKGRMKGDRRGRLIKKGGKDEMEDRSRRE
jgi:hypothetical protein